MDSYDPSGTMYVSCHSPTCCRDLRSVRLILAHAVRWNMSGADAYAYSFSFDSQYWTT